jgi:3-methyladenine DNA glycosylase AlkD
MPRRATKTVRAPAKPPKAPSGRTTSKAMFAELERIGTKANRDSLARYGITAPKSFGVPVGTLQKLAKPLGRDHALALELWDSGWYEARLLTAFLAEPERVTRPQVERWARDFDSWAVVDTLCFHLLDRTPFALAQVDAWSRRREEFVKRGAFALLASVALHDERASDAELLRRLPRIEAAATDERNFVKKGVSWALRSLGHRNLALHRACVDLARRLAASEDATSRWIGKDALRDLTRPAVAARLEKRSSRS